MAQVKDIVSKEILKNLAKELTEHILKIPIDDELELIDKEFTRVEKRDADILFRSANRIIHIEIQNSNHSKMHKRMLRYYSDLLFDYEEYEILQFVIYIGREKCTMINSIKRYNIDYKYNLINMKDLPCREFLNSSDPSAIALSILCDFEEEDKQSVINEILLKLQKYCEDGIEFQKYFKIVEILSTNRDLEDELKEGEKMLVIDMEKWPSYQIGLEKGEKEGIQKGIQKGIDIAKREMAKELKKKGIDIDTISEITGLDIDSIKQI